MKKNTSNQKNTMKRSLVYHFTSYMENHVFLYDFLLTFIEKIPVSDGFSMLDLGCGSGILLERMEMKYPHSRCIGLDPSSDMINIAKKRKRYRSSYFIIGSAEDIPLQDHMVDMVISRFSICYWSDIRKSLDEIHRILTSDGFIIFELLNKNFSPVQRFLVQMRMRLHHAPSDVISYHMDAYHQAYTKHEIKSYLKDAGFDIVSTYGKDREWRFIVIGKKKRL